MNFKKTLIASSVAVGILHALSSVAIAEENKPEQKNDDVEVITVEGIRGSVIASLSAKRHSNSIIESITAEDIGKLPDITIADTLQRVTGVQIQRSAGEGAQVNVRGLSQVTTLMNGEQFISAGSITGLTPDFGDIPAELLGGVDVYKAAEASLMNGGISGTIDLRSRRPMNLAKDGWSFVASAEASQGSFTDDTGEKVTGFAGYKGEDFGLIVTATSSESTLANYRYGMWGDFWQGFVDDIDGDGVNEEVFGNIDYGITNKTATRDRTGLSTSLQYFINDDIEITAEAFYTKMSNDDLANGLIIDNNWSKNQGYINPIEYVNRGSSFNGSGRDLITSSIYEIQAPRIKSNSEAVVSERDSLNFNLQANVNFTDAFTGTFRYVHGEATNKLMKNFVDAYTTSGEQSAVNRSIYIDGERAPVNPGGYGPEDAAVLVDTTGKHPSFAFPSALGHDISNYALVSTFSENNADDESNLDAVRFDGSYEFENEFAFIENASIDFGTRYGVWKVSSQKYDLAAPVSALNRNGEEETAYAKWKDISGTISSGGETIQPVMPISFEHLYSQGYVTEITDFGPANTFTYNGNYDSISAAQNGYYFIDTNVMRDVVGFQNSLYPGNVKANRWTNTYEVEDTSFTSYVQLNIDGELVFPFSANFGVQAVNREREVTSYNEQTGAGTLEVGRVNYKSILGVPDPRVGKTVTTNKTLDFLPRVNIAFDLQEDLKLRLSYVENLTQLDANTLGGGSSTTFVAHPTLEGVFSATQVNTSGNPDLQPWSSTNLDLSLEWYFNDQGLLNFGLYQIDIDSFPTGLQTTIYGIADTDGVVRNDGLEHFTLTNGDGGKLEGFEVGYQQAYDFLPGFLSGLGSNINYTWTDGEGGDTDFYGESTIVGGISEEQANVILWYQKHGLEVRLAYNYRSDRYIQSKIFEATTEGSNRVALYVEPTEFVDLSVSYEVNDNFEVYLLGQNITEEYETTYAQWKDAKVSQNVFESRYSLGLRGKF
ncbi:TonB-dependent receptor [Thalassotalea sp. PLHSN55]|uniref:TonB-dependent receptor n=1 Tax=Thalassotalea sp. PLHSN55 TaxID=3435888 RepID=UPI003F83F296